ncbi:MAG: ATP phosphoribosyltransferase [Ignavibacteria bacterium]|nr:ATP phosphoribosyltransferase [Ignavibacteria bacterium]MBI3765517.1 ATP phosphoribosyltransferase [Ignavibacteriales bacterium]
MIATNGRLKLAIQKEGRITEESTALLRAMGLDFDLRSRALFSPCRNYLLDILSVRDDDIPEYVQDCVSEFGIVGENIIAEKNARVKIVEHLGFGKCQLVVCAPKSGSIKELSALKGKRIATSYPRTVKRFLQSNSIPADIIEISGSVEITPTLDVADATCDIISTGSTARVNGLEVIHTVMTSEAVLIANPASLKSAKKKREIDQLLIRFRSVLSARGKKYVMMNAPAAAVEKIKQLVPGMKSPTVVPLTNPGMVAIHSVVGENIFWEVIEKLKHAGASDIIVVPIEKFFA